MENRGGGGSPSTACACANLPYLAGRGPRGDRPAPVNHVGLCQPPLSGRPRPPWRPACARQPRGFVPTSPIWQAQAPECGGWHRIGGLDARQPRVPVPTSPIWQAAAPWRPACARQPRGFVPTSPFWQAQAPECGGWHRIGGLDARQPREPVPISPIWAGGATKRPWASSGIKRSSAVGVSPGLYAQNLRLAKVMHTSTRDDLPAAQDRLRAAASPAPH